MNLREEFIGWNSLRIKQKSKRLAYFIETYGKKFSHAELDEICSEIWDLFEGMEENQ